MDESKRFSDPFLQVTWNTLVRINSYLTTADKQWNPVELGIAPRNMARDIVQAEIDRPNATVLEDVMHLRFFFK